MRFQLLRQWCGNSIGSITATPAGRMMMQIVGACAEFEKSMLKERTKAGLDAARKEGRIGGRRPKSTQPRCRGC